MDPQALLIDVLLPFGTLAVGYLLGRRLDRDKTLYEERTRIVTGIRERPREIQQECLKWSAPHHSLLSSSRRRDSSGDESPMNREAAPK
jgi:hypothetical protein